MESDENSLHPKQVFTCKYCPKTFLTKFSIGRHIRQQHAAENEKDNPTSFKRSSRIICPASPCDNNFHNYSALRKHLKNIHSFEVEYENLSFNSLERFKLWKTNIEQKTLSSYTKDSSTKISKGDAKTFYDCHRSYHYAKTGGNIRAMKMIGSNKIGKACPSRMEVICKKGDAQPKVLVKFWKSHCGHTAEIERIHLSNEIRMKIAEKLKEGFSFDQILESVRKYGKSHENAKRLMRLGRKDLWNIANEFNIKYATEEN